MNQLSQANFQFASNLMVDEQMKRTFHTFHSVKRRNPNKYMKNPTKIYFTTLGKKDYAFQNKAKEDSISFLLR